MTFQWRHVRLGINPASIDSARKIPVVFFVTEVYDCACHLGGAETFLLSLENIRQAFVFSRF